MRRIAARIVRATPAARLACINVLKLARLTIDRAIDEDGTNKHAARLGALRRWAQPLNLPDDRVTYHTLENVDPAGAILDYVARNRVDHIVIGARADVKLAGILGSVAAQAPCTVTIVRKRHFGTKTAPQ
jgi:non-specific serine/threonine protein kinase/protein-serine/threonine kinase